MKPKAKKGERPDLEYAIRAVEQTLVEYDYDLSSYRCIYCGRSDPFSDLDHTYACVVSVLRRRLGRVSDGD